MTNTPKYTQGPWRVGDAGHTVFGPKTEQLSPISIAHIAESNRTTREEKKASARLIAQAPAMAELLARKDVGIVNLLVLAASAIETPDDLTEQEKTNLATDLLDAKRKAERILSAIDGEVRS